MHPIYHGRSKPDIYILGGSSLILTLYIYIYIYIYVTKYITIFIIIYKYSNYNICNVICRVNTLY